MGKLTVVYWRDIPAQVIAKHGRRSARVQLSERFQEAIDRAAMRAGKGGTDAYLEEWRRVTEDCDSALDAAAAVRAAELEAAFDDDALAALVRSQGVASAANPAEKD